MHVSYEIYSLQEENDMLELVCGFLLGWLFTLVVLFKWIFGAHAWMVTVSVFAIVYVGVIKRVYR